MAIARPSSSAWPPGQTRLEVLLAAPRGYCAGVVRAIDIVDLALERFGPPIYVRKEIVHNRYVVDGFRARGVVFVDDLDEVPEGALVIFSAHGVSPAVRRAAAARGLRTIDATCPLVAKVHLEAIRFAREGYSIVLIGHRGHEETEGTMGEAPEHTHLVTSLDEIDALDLPDPSRVAYLTQTTLSVDDTAGLIAALRARFPALVGPPHEDICYATQNRQSAVKQLAEQVDLMLVIGSPNSSNTNRLVEVAEVAGTPARRIATADEIEPAWLDGARRIGVTAGASAPEELVQAVVERLGDLAGGSVAVREVTFGVERVHFALPPELGNARRDPAASS